MSVIDEAGEVIFEDALSNLWLYESQEDWMIDGDEKRIGFIKFQDLKNQDC